MIKNIIKTIVAVVVIALVVLLAAAAVDKYQTKTDKDNAAKAQQEQAFQSLLKAEQAKSTKLESAYRNERLNCEKGLKAFNALTVPEKLKAGLPTAPVCGSVIIK
jgi:type II secretory pathway pseudopilin PulG